MPARFLTHLSFLIAAVCLTFFWTKSPLLSFYTLQAISVLVILYFVNHFLNKTNHYSVSLDGFIFAIVTLLLVSQTGGLISPLFFLLYILLFGLSLMFEPAITITFTAILILFFSRQINNLTGVIQVTGLLLMTPLALFFGKQYLRVLEGAEKIQILNKKQKELTEEVSQQEEDTLIWLSLSFKDHVVKIIDASSNLLADVSHLTISQKENLQKIHESAKRLLKLGDKLKEKIEE